MKPQHSFKKKALALIVTGASVLTLAAAPAWAQTPSVGTTSSGTVAPMSKAKSDMKAATAEDPSKLVRGDAKMLGDLAQGNMAEVDAGKLALEKSSDAGIKKFAQMMIDDHTAALGEVEKLATSKSVTLPTGPSVMQKTKATALKALSGSLFDKEYAKHAGVGAHESTVKLLKKIQKDSKDADLKALADKMLPKVEGHLAEAKALAASTTAKKS
ncbi:MAG: DUF4142 domain-containing protein [Pseudomonadota bacterium]